VGAPPHECSGAGAAISDRAGARSWSLNSIVVAGQIQRGVKAMLPGTPERATHDYKRSGTSSCWA
jgi:hypothetical protein